MNQFVFAIYSFGTIPMRFGKHRSFFIKTVFVYAIIKFVGGDDFENEISEEPHSLWKESNNEFFSAIQSEAKNIYIFDDYKSVLEEDFKPFKKITKALVDAASTYGVKYQLLDHKLYRSKECMFPARCQGVEHFLQKFVNLSDYEIIVNTRDYPQIFKGRNEILPVLSFSKTRDYFDIMYPAWSFWCGGPAIKLHPKGIGRWDIARKSLITASKKWPWDDKKNRAFFRGSRTSDQRDQLILLSRESPDLVDAAYTKNQAWKSEKDTLYAQPAEEASFEHHCEYKYLFSFRGVAASFRFKHLFLCGSLVFHIGAEWIEFFYPAMKAWRHYIPLDSNHTKDDLKAAIEFFKSHDDIARNIAQTGQEFVKANLKMKNVDRYWLRLLERYISILDYKPEFDSNLVPLNNKK